MRPLLSLILFFTVLPSDSALAAPIAPSDPAPIARLLAGVEAGESAAGREHAAALDEAFAELEKVHLGPMRTWAGQTLHQRIPSDPAPSFYPFGGPDLITALVLYPDAPSWTLIGLEPPGSVADPASLSEDDLARELPRVRAALSPVVNAGYFVKKWMEQSLASESFPGILPVLLVFLTREGYVPESVEPIGLDPEGRIVDAEPGAGLRIRARAHDGETREVIYLRQNLADDELASSPGFARYLDRIAPYDAWIKAGHYLLHEAGFGVFRGLLLEGSRSLLQDDSAVPWRHLDPNVFDLSLYGEYENILPAYRKYFQDDLAASYASNTDIAALPFHIGYHAKIGGGPLILAVRQAPDPAP